MGNLPKILWFGVHRSYTYKQVPLYISMWAASEPTACPGLAYSQAPRQYNKIPSFSDYLTHKVFLIYITQMCPWKCGGAVKGARETEGSTWLTCAMRWLQVGLQASVRCIWYWCYAYGGLGAWWKVARREGKQKVFMADMHHMHAVGWATCVSKAYVMCMWCTWRCGGTAEDGKEGEVEGFMADVCHTKAVG